MSSKPLFPIILFASADIVGATAYKSKHAADEESMGWLDALETFFRLTPLRFVGRFAEVFAYETSLPNYSVWKVLGDEIVFVAMPKSRNEIANLTRAFLRTVRDCNETIMKPFGLSVRGCCWAAQLTGRNRAVHIPEMTASYLDYLGPDVDTGFRISSFAGPAEVAFSFNLIRSLARTEPELDLRFELRGHEVLKGVTMQEPYPIVVCSSFQESKSVEEATDSSVDLRPAASIVEEILADHPRPTLLEAGDILFD